MSCFHLSLQVTHSAAAPAQLQWAARSLCPHTPLKRTGCLRRLLRPPLWPSPARPPQHRCLLLRLPPAPRPTTLPTGTLRNTRQTAVPPPLTSHLPLPGLAPSLLQPSRLPLCRPPRPLYSPQRGLSLLKETRLPPCLL